MSPTHDQEVNIIVNGRQRRCQDHRSLSSRSLHWPLIRFLQTLYLQSLGAMATKVEALLRVTAFQSKTG